MKTNPTRKKMPARPCLSALLLLTLPACRATTPAVPTSATHLNVVIVEWTTQFRVADGIDARAEAFSFCAPRGDRREKQEHRHT